MDSDPSSISSHFKSSQFSQKITSPTPTHPFISFAEIGPKDGVPVLFIGEGSRWSATPLDERCRDMGIKLIVVDRPGIGSTSPVPRHHRLDVHSQNIISVLQYLDIKPRHLIAYSTGIYYAPHLLLLHPNGFGGGQPILISPRVPPLSPTIQTTGRQELGFDPSRVFVLRSDSDESSSPLVEVEHVDVDPSGFIKHGWRDKIPLFAKVRGNNHTGDGKDEPSEWFRAASIKATDLILADEYQGIAQEIHISENRESANTGREWFKRTLEALSNRWKSEEGEIVFTIWTSQREAVVSRESNLWLEKTIKSIPRMSCNTYQTKDGNHSDLLWRDDGIRQVFAMIHFRERVYYGG